MRNYSDEQVKSAKSILGIEHMPNKQLERASLKRLYLEKIQLHHPDKLAGLDQEALNAHLSAAQEINNARDVLIEVIENLTDYAEPGYRFGDISRRAYSTVQSAYLAKTGQPYRPGDLVLKPVCYGAASAVCSIASAVSTATVSLSRAARAAYQAFYSEEYQVGDAVCAALEELINPKSDLKP